MSFSVDATTCQNLRESLRWEWLETDGGGGYASSTILHCHTRRYHALLAPNLPDPPGTFVLLSKYEDSLVSEEQEFFLSIHRYPGVYFPHGHQYLRGFRLDEHPSFSFAIGEVKLQKDFMLVEGRRMSLMRYELKDSPRPVTLRIKPLLAFRGFHELRREDLFLQVRTYPAPNGFKIRPYNGLPPLVVQTSVMGEFYPAPLWFRQFEYFVEAERGFDNHEDLFHPGVFELPLKPRQAVVLAAGLDEIPNPSELPDLWAAELSRRRQCRRQTAAIRVAWAPAKKALPVLAFAGRQFLVHHPNGRPGIIAGFPWFGEWTRDTLIALPGLTFCCGRNDEGRAILVALATHEANGLLPNFFGSDPEHHAYNSVDASLWFFRAIQHLLEHTGDLETIRSALWPTMLRILRRLMEGTIHDIRINGDGLLHAGNRHTQLTWMDAMVDGVPVTPRHGYAVEINALWYNALCFAEELASRFGEPLPWSRDLVSQVRDAFVRMFWLPQERRLADAVSDGKPDVSVRPNQLFAAALPHSMLDSDQQQAVLESVRSELLTPFGLRTLSPRDVSYHGRYEGGPAERDRAYHQGTVWPWLLGPYTDVLLKTAPDPALAAEELMETVQPLLDYALEGQGLGHIPEVFDGDPPHRPNGCIAQAWNTGELIRALRLCANAVSARRPARRVRSASARPRKGGRRR